MMMLAAWNTLDEVAAYLLDRTGEPWTSRAVLERLSNLKPETVRICPPVGIPFLILKDGCWEKWTYSYPMLFEVRGGHLASSLHQWLISNSAENIQMVHGNNRFQTVAQIPMEWVRINRSDVDMLPTVFHRLVDELASGRYPELRGELDSSGADEEFSDTPSHRTEVHVEAAARERSKGTRADAMKLLLQDLVPEMQRQGRRVNGGTVMAELKKTNDPCVVDTKPEGVVWERVSGKPETLTITALNRRLKRMNLVGGKVK
ncbi:hypothetical protein MW7_005935 [Imbroritus primus]|uniref:Uncharacterized protein n=1 Tax=Imbroritus primus TaxID=3058603 RepID=A0ACD3SQ87_9BURK|nr:hypothetical protein MW7_005935 [Burkholderiaceae bacterium PBA]